jgi:hypothetical protein
LRISEEQRIAQFRGTALCLNGWALGVSGESEKGLAQLAKVWTAIKGGANICSWRCKPTRNWRAADPKRRWHRSPPG